MNPRKPFWTEGGTLSEENFRLVRYYTRIWLLQERANLSLLEARVFTRAERPESLDDLAHNFKIDSLEVESLVESVEEKVRALEKKGIDIFCGYDAVY